MKMQKTQQAAELLEAWGDVVPTSEGSLFGDLGSTTGSMLAKYQRPATTLYDRSDGRFLPVYQNEFDLAVIRAMGRTLEVVSPNLAGGLRNMRNYTIGEGFTFTATREPTASVSEETAAPLLKAVQFEINRLLDDTEFVNGLDNEIHTASIVDGEVLLHIKPCADGRVRIYRKEPDQLRQPYETRELEEWIEGVHGIPCSEFVPSWSFGVLTRLDTPEEPLAYHLVSDEAGMDWDFLPASRVVHIKRNVTRNAKRGFSDLYPIEADSVRGEKLRRNIAEGAAVQAAIAYVKEYTQGASLAATQTTLGQNSTGQVQMQTAAGGTRTVEKVRHPPGTTIAAAGWKFVPGPMGAERAQDFLLVAAYVQRTQAVRWSMPEYMFSGDASNANYSSTMVAESPFVKSCEAEQRFYTKHFVSTIWKALRIRFEMGAFNAFGIGWESLERLVKITAECPEVATRDRNAAVQTGAILVDKGAMSVETFAAQNGLDYSAEVAKGAKPVGGEAQTQPGRETPQSGGEFANTSTLQWKRNVKAIDTTLDRFKAGEISKEQAHVYLTAAGLAPERADKLLAGEPDAEVDAAVSAEGLSESLLNLVECGGEGGTPGPCPSGTAGDSKQSQSSTTGKSKSEPSEKSASQRPKKPRAPVASKVAAPPVTPEAAQARARTPQDFEKVGERLVNRRKLEDPASGIDVKSGVAAVRNYTDSDNYEPMNRGLREGGDPTKVPPQPQTAHLQKLASQPLSEPTVTYRGISHEMFDSDFGKAKVGAVITAKGFQSTSLDPGVGAGFAAGDTATRGYPVMEIKAKSGVFVGDLSHAENEHEVIQAHGTKYRLVGIEHGVKVHHRTVTMIRVEEI